MKRIAILGGAFDPVTIGHLELAREVERLDFEVIFMPCGDRHSFEKHMLPAKHRMELLRLAIGPRRICEIEIDQRTWRAADTHPLLTRAYGPVHWVIGSDNANCLHHWHQGERLKSEIAFIVYNRRGHPLTQEGAWCLQEPHCYIDLGDVREVSSTQARSAIARGDWNEARKLVPEPVLERIREAGWYPRSAPGVASVDSEECRAIHSC